MQRLKSMEASGLRLVMDKTLGASNLGLMRRLALSTCHILHLFKIITHKMRSFDDVLSFSVKPKMFKIPRITWKDNHFEFYLFTAMLLLD